MKLKKILICIILLIVILTNSGYKAFAAADPAIVEVIGGSIAAGGIAATAAAIFPPAMIIVGLVMVAQGIDIALTEASEEAGMTKTEFIGSKFEEFCDATKQDFDLMCNRIALQTQILKDGSILLAEEASNVIGQFINNLTANNEIITAPAFANDYILVNNVKVPILKNGESLNYADNMIVENIGSSDVAMFVGTYGGNPWCIMFTLGSRFNYIYTNALGMQSTLNQTGDSLGYGRYKTLYGVQTGTVLHVPYVDGWASAFQQMQTFDLLSGGITEDSFIGENVDTSVLYPEAGYQNVINPGLEIPGLASGHDGVVSVRDYIDALGKAIDGVQDLTIAVQDAYTGVITDINVGAYDVTRDVSLTTEEENEDTVATPLVDVEAMPTGSEAEEALQNLQFDLTAIFPFCIPFDIYALIQKFDVAPAAPAMHIIIPLGGLGEDLEFDLDLAPWETVARVLRTMELIAFVVGLAMVTRNIIRG